MNVCVCSYIHKLTRMQVQALRSVQKHLEELGLEKLYVMGTNCADNGPSREALATFFEKSLAGTEFSSDDIKV